MLLNIVGDNTLGPDVDQRGHTAGGPGVGQIHGVYDLKFFPDNKHDIGYDSNSGSGGWLLFKNN